MSAWSRSLRLSSEFFCSGERSTRRPRTDSRASMTQESVSRGMSGPSSSRFTGIALPGCVNAPLFRNQLAAIAGPPELEVSAKSTGQSMASFALHRDWTEGRREVAPMRKKLSALSPVCARPEEYGSAAGPATRCAKQPAPLQHGPRGLVCDRPHHDCSPSGGPGANRPRMGAWPASRRSMAGPRSRASRARAAGPCAET